MNNNSSIGLSYYRLSLLSFLIDFHPEKKDDQLFITTRGDQAAEAYSEVIQEGGTHLEAKEAASQILFKGLLFSPFETIKKVLYEQFSFIPEDRVPGYAIKYLPELGDILAKYTLDDTFEESPLYNSLYLEITGWLTIEIEDNGI